jgi:hypothetical protein
LNVERWTLDVERWTLGVFHFPRSSFVTTTADRSAFDVCCEAAAGADGGYGEPPLPPITDN